MATTRIKELRESTGLSQTEFSQRYGIPRLTLISWENGTRHCPVYTVELLKFRIEHEERKEDKEMNETKWSIINYLMSEDVDRHNCGPEGSNSYCERKKAYQRMTKAELLDVRRMYNEGREAYELGLD